MLEFEIIPNSKQQISSLRLFTLKKGPLPSNFNFLFNIYFPLQLNFLLALLQMRFLSWDIIFVKVRYHLYAYMCVSLKYEIQMLCWFHRFHQSNIIVYQCSSIFISQMIELLTPQPTSIHFRKGRFNKLCHQHKWSLWLNERYFTLTDKYFDLILKLSRHIPTILLEPCVSWKKDSLQSINKIVLSSSIFYYS